ncbi:MAG: ABC transporter ATP-binding protein, partial [Kiritimatiellae bacterium]|nr:ABC transporter ATP-binding protein [Kiritimatiellia bacterium]
MTPERTDTTPLLHVKNLRCWFPIKKGIFARTVGWVRAVDGVDLTLQPGETLGIVGESGCGKSSLARTILRLNKPQNGEILLNGVNVLKLRGAALQRYRRELQVVFQDPQASLNPRHTILDILTEAAVVHKLVKKEERRTFATRLLKDVGLPESVLDRYPHEFSGGQRQRICIARALALDPKLLICDEAVSALDLSIRAQVLNLLEEIQEKRGLSYLFITHDIGVVEHIADRILVMYLGRVMESGPTETVLSAPAHPYTQLLLSAVPRIGKRLPEEEKASDPISSAARGEGCPFAPRCPKATDRCRKEAPAIRPLAEDPARACACHLVV